MEIIHISNNQQRILKPRKSLNSPEEAASVKKCLFGVPDPEDVENMLQEQIREDWERIRKNYGIDIEDVENVESPTKKRKLARRRRLFAPYNGRKITDFYQARKNVQQEKKEV